MIVQLENKLENSAIPFFMNFPFCYAHPNTEIQFNSLSYNFLPHGGETYFLKNLPSNLGAYLALTCETLNSKDLMDLNLVFDVGVIDEDQIKTLKHFTHTEEIFSTFYEAYKSEH